jgi:hypothetical protein
VDRGEYRKLLKETLRIRRECAKCGDDEDAEPLIVILGYACPECLGRHRAYSQLN